MSGAWERGPQSTEVIDTHIRSLGKRSFEYRGMRHPCQEPILKGLRLVTMSGSIKLWVLCYTELFYKDGHFAGTWPDWAKH